MEFPRCQQGSVGSCSHLDTVSESHTSAQWRRARVTATFMRRRSARNPTSPAGLERTCAAGTGLAASIKIFDWHFTHTAASQPGYIQPQCLDSASGPLHVTFYHTAK